MISRTIWTKNLTWVPLLVKALMDVQDLAFAPAWLALSIRRLPHPGLASAFPDILLMACLRREVSMMDRWVLWPDLLQSHVTRSYLWSCPSFTDRQKFYAEELRVNQTFVKGLTAAGGRKWSLTEVQHTVGLNNDVIFWAKRSRLLSSQPWREKSPTQTNESDLRNKTHVDIFNCILFYRSTFVCLCALLPPSESRCLNI